MPSAGHQQSLTGASSSHRRTDENLPNKLQTRYVMAIMGFICFFVKSSLITNMSIGLIAMVNWTDIANNGESIQDDQDNESQIDVEEDGPMRWDTITIGYILASFFYGFAVMQILGRKISNWMGAEYALLGGTLVAALANSLVPVTTALTPPYFVMILQVAKGLGQGIVLPSFAMLMYRWIPDEADGRTIFLTCLSSGLPIGAFFTVFISGVLAKENWANVFYFVGVFAFLWCFAWSILMCDTPLHHPAITPSERQRLSVMQAHGHTMNNGVPLKAILNSSSVWAYVLVGFAEYWILSLYITAIPIFVKTVLQVSLSSNGMILAFPWLAEAIVFLTSVRLQNYILRNLEWSVTTLRKISICTGLTGFSVCVLVISFAGCNLFVGIGLLILGLGMAAFSFNATSNLPTDMSLRYAGTLTRIMNLSILSGAIVPTITGHIIHDAQTINEWANLFYVSAAICLLAAIIFAWKGSGDTQPWNQSSHEILQPPPGLSGKPVVI